jgi:dihydroorotate dehydrogenase (fumarate)/dihydropyrimidine dehydrogenase (NAD+) subunit PreA
LSEQELAVTIGGIAFKNPIVVASGTPTKNARYMKKAIDAGAGGVVSKSVTTNVLLQKYVRPRFTILQRKGWPYSFSNYSCEFLANESPGKWAHEMKTAKKLCEEADVVLIGSVGGGSLEDWISLSTMLVDAGADMLELNFGCPHPRGHKLGFEVGRDPELCSEIVRAVRKEAAVPIFVKVTPEAVDVLETVRAVREAGANGVTAINRFPALDIDLDTGRPLLHGSFAGVGGPWMLPITLKWIAKIASAFPQMPISATNGIWTWKDVAKCIMVGATTVQVCTAILYGVKGYAIVGDMLNGLKSFVASKNCDTITDLRGITLNQIKTFDELDRETKTWSVVDESKCSGCMLCMNWCYYDAISPVRGKVSIDPTKCDGCGLCVALCPPRAVRMEGAKVYL